MERICLWKHFQTLLDCGPRKDRAEPAHRRRGAVRGGVGGKGSPSDKNLWEPGPQVVKGQ